MKNSKIISLLSLSILLGSCSDMYDTKYNNEWTEESVWGNAITVQAVLDDIYTGISRRPDTYDSNFLDAATDNAMSSYSGSTVTDLTSGNYSSQSNPLSNWSTNYSYIQHACYFLENSLSDNIVYNFESDDNNEGIMYRLRGEAFFLRAFFNFDLLQIYGGKSDYGEALGYPIITEFTSTEDAAAMLLDYKRNTYRECIDQIQNDLDSAYYYLALPLAAAQAEVGRANSNVAQALKSRVALYSASPAYQSDDVVKIVDMGKFTVVDETEYQNQWTKVAKITYDALVNTGDTFYGITASDMADVTTTTPSEYLLRFYFNNRTMEGLHFLPRYFGTAYTVPSQNLVDAFPMSNGYPITDVRSSYNPNDPYANRDSRFYLNVYYHGAEYGSATYASELSPLTTVDVTPDGADGLLSSTYASRTGYYLAKFMSKNFNMNDPTGTSNSAHYWAELRRTELALNYAEAANEAFGPTGTYATYIDDDGEEYGVAVEKTAYEIIKTLRSQSGGITNTEYLDEMAQSKESFRELIQNERRIELAFENHRFFDLRRCLLPLDEPLYGVSVTEESGVTQYEMIEVEERKFYGIKHYYLPLPTSEVIKGLKNNWGWY